MKKMIAGIVIAVALGGSTMAGQIQSSAQVNKPEQKSASVSLVKSKDGTDCQPQRAGVRCSRRKPRKPWFFGK